MFKEFDFLLQQCQDVALRLVNRADLHAEFPGHLGRTAALLRRFHVRRPGVRLDAAADVLFGLFQEFQVVLGTPASAYRSWLASTSSTRPSPSTVAATPLASLQVRHQAVGDGLEVAAESPLCRARTRKSLSR